MLGRDVEKENSFVWLVKAPFCLLIMARDAYIRSITACSGTGILTGGGSSDFGQPTGHLQICDPPNTALLRSFTLTSACDQDFVTHGGDLTTTTEMRQSPPLDHRKNYRCFVVMGRIDEEFSCDDDFEEDSFQR